MQEYIRILTLAKPKRAPQTSPAEHVSLMVSAAVISMKIVPAAYIREYKRIYKNMLEYMGMQKNIQENTRIYNNIQEYIRNIIEYIREYMRI